MDRKLCLSLLAVALSAVLTACSGTTSLSVKATQDPTSSERPMDNAVTRAAGDVARGAKDAADDMARGTEEAARDAKDAAQDIGAAIGFDRMVDDARWPVREANNGHN